MGTQIINGKYTSATIFTTDNMEQAIDDYALAQLRMLCDLEANANCKIRVMPDVHPGKVGTIGLTMTLGSKIMPNLTGIDIGCGMSLIQIKDRKIEFQKLDKIIRDHVPSGYAIRKNVHHSVNSSMLDDLVCRKHIEAEKALLSCGSLGSGNHFIEVDQDEDKNTYVIVHSGSRRLGKEITEHYLKEGQRLLLSQGINIPYELTYLENELMQNYLHDIAIAQEFARMNREVILSELTKEMRWKVIDAYGCHHNYVEFDDTPILRKGAISARSGEKVIIPINMRDGIILGTGLGNAEWNYSAPHGSGRIMKREAVKNHFTLSQFKKSMSGIYSPSISKDTLDEAPFAYRGMDDIVDAIKDTVEITKIIRPVYNFKAGGED